MSENNAYSQKIVAALNAGVEDLDPAVAQRLHIARFEALALVPARQLKLKLALAGGMDFSMLGWHASRQKVASFALALTLSLTALIGYQWWHEEVMEDEIASIDANLLSSELPPSAFAHDSFGEWLQDSR
jgi:hypothetical protein